jgi:hypothetical protein
VQRVEANTCRMADGGHLSWAPYQEQAQVVAIDASENLGPRFATHGLGPHVDTGANSEHAWQPKKKNIFERGEARLKRASDPEWNATGGDLSAASADRRVERDNPATILGHGGSRLKEIRPPGKQRAHWERRMALK